MPLEPPTPRTSILGLDKLAKEKRAAAEAERGQTEGSRKKPRLEDEEPVFKGKWQEYRSFYLSLHIVKFQAFLKRFQIYDKEVQKHLLTLVDCRRLGARD